MGQEDSLSAVRADIHRLDAKLNAKIDSSFHRLAKEIVGLQADVAEFKANVMTKADGARIIGLLESFAGQTQHQRNDVILHGRVLTDAQVLLKDHERRIKRLEDRFQ